MRPLLIIALSVMLTLAISLSSFAPTEEKVKDNGLMKRQSKYSVKETADRFESAIKAKGLTFFARINHSENAKRVGKELRPTELIIFGNPKAGTPLMLSNQTIGIDLPQKALIWQDESGKVWVACNKPKYLAKRHNITDQDELIKNIKKLLGTIMNESCGISEDK